MAKTKTKPSHVAVRKPRRVLVPDELSESYRFIDDTARVGQRIDTTGMTEAEVRAAFLGQRRDG